MTKVTIYENHGDEDCDEWVCLGEHFVDLGADRKLKRDKEGRRGDRWRACAERLASELCSYSTFLSGESNAALAAFNILKREENGR
jgi:hypothetical protein